MTWQRDAELRRVLLRQYQPGSDGRTDVPNAQTRRQRASVAWTDKTDSSTLRVDLSLQPVLVFATVTVFFQVA